MDARATEKIVQHNKNRCVEQLKTSVHYIESEEKTQIEENNENEIPLNQSPL